jgi:hypothetical protein
MAMMSRGECQCLHWVRGVRERPWTRAWLPSSVVVEVDTIDVGAVSMLVVDALFELLVDVGPLESPLLQKIAGNAIVCP